MTQASHRASLAPAAGRYVARVGKVILAQSRRARILQEVNGAKTYRPVVYFPLADVDPACLTPSDHRTHCPIKGDAGYYSVRADGAVLENAAWFYADPLPMVAGLKDHVAFYPDRVTVEQA